jgi:hypothetical protein
METEAYEIPVILAGALKGETSSTQLFTLPNDLLDHVLQNLSLEDLRSLSLVNKCLLSATNAVRKSVQLDRCAGREMLLRLEERFGSATALKLGTSKYSWDIILESKDIQGIVSSMTCLESVDLGDSIQSKFRQDTNANCAGITLMSTFSKFQKLKGLTLKSGGSPDPL